MLLVRGREICQGGRRGPPAVFNNLDWRDGHVEAALCSIGRDAGVAPFVEAVLLAALSGPTKGLRRSAAAHESLGGALHNRPFPSIFSEVLISTV